MTSSGILHRLLRYVRPYRGWIAGAFLFALAQVTLTLSGPVVIGRIVDLIAGFGQVQLDSVVRLLVLLAAIFAGAALFQYLMTLCTNACCYRTVRDLRKECFAKFSALPLADLDQGQQGDFMNTMVNDIDVIADGLLQGATQLFTGIVMIAGTLGFMLAIQPLIAVIVVLMTPVSLLAASRIAGRSARLFRQQASIKGRLSGFAEEMISHQDIITAYNHQRPAEEQFAEINGELNRIGTQVQFISSLTNPATRFVNNLVYALVGIIGALVSLRGGLSVGQLSSFLSYASQYTKPFNEISGVVTELQAALSSGQRVFTLLDRQEESERADLEVKTAGTGAVTLDHVCFRYRPSVPLIEDFCLDVRPGQKIAIVGPTGCGKTTLINLLLRFYEIQNGEIRLDGTNCQKLSRANVRQFYGMVLQDSWVFHGTLRDNIAYGRPDASQEEIEQAARQAHLEPLIMQLPQGYDTVLDESVCLSQGQKQLLCIARVLVCDPEILILDEATSSIDTRTELLVQSAFDQMMKKRTSFVVAHRLSTIEQADRILVMNQGRIIEQGTHYELLKQKGFYAQLYNSQFAEG